MIKRLHNKRTKKVIALSLLVMLTVQFFIINVYGAEFTEPSQNSEPISLSWYGWSYSVGASAWTSYRTDPLNISGIDGALRAVPWYELSDPIKGGYTYIFNFWLNPARASYDLIDGTLTNRVAGTNISRSNPDTWNALEYYAAKFSYFTEFTPEYIKIQFVAYFANDIPFSQLKYIGPYLYHNDATNFTAYIARRTATSYRDPNQTFFQRAIKEGLDSILDELQSGNQLTQTELQNLRNSFNSGVTALQGTMEINAIQAHNDAERQISVFEQMRQQLHDDIVGDPSEANDNSTLSSDISNYQNAEDSINDALEYDITIDGQRFSLDDDIFGQLRTYVQGLSSPSYDISVGQQFAKIWDLIFEFLGVPIMLTLTLGVALAFLKGRSKAE